MGDEHLPPNEPRGWSYKSAWYAIQTMDTAAVVEEIELQNPRAASWKEGYHVIYGSYSGEKAWDDPSVFVTPPIGGWTAVTALHLALRKQSIPPALERLSGRFGTAAFFVTFRVSDLYGWLKAENGRVIRAFWYSGGNDELRWNFGPLTPEEGLLHFPAVELEIGLSDPPIPMWDPIESWLYDQENDLPIVFPSENLPLDLASLWAFDPSAIAKNPEARRKGGIIGYHPRLLVGDDLHTKPRKR